MIKKLTFDDGSFKDPVKRLAYSNDNLRTRGSSRNAIRRNYVYR